MKIFNIKIIIGFLSLLLYGCGSDTGTQHTAIPKTGNPRIDQLTELIFKNPKDAKLYFERAQLFQQNAEHGGADYAIEDMKYALSLDSTNVTYHHFLADVYMDYRQSRLALMTMERCAELYPKRVETLLKLAEFYLLLQQYSESLKVVDKVLQLDPQHSEGYFMLGMNMKQTGKSEQAIKAFQRAADWNARNKDAFLELGHLYEQKNDPKALQYFDNALAIGSLDEVALLAKGVYLHQHRQSEAATEVYKRIIGLNRHNKNAFFNLGLLYFENDSLEQARQHFNIVIETLPKYVLNDEPILYKAYYYRGACLEKQGDKRAAMADYKKVLSISPNYEPAKSALLRLGVK